MGLELLQEEVRSLLGNRARRECEEEAGNVTNLADVHKASEILLLSEQLHSSADSAVDILNDLLNYDKIERGNLTLERTIIPIWALVERTVREFGLAASSKNIKLIVGFQFDESTVIESTSDLTKEQKELRVIGDTVRITQVVRNFVSNALKFTKEGGKWTTAHNKSLTAA
jgi:signal transduction histidine kinase